MGHIYNNLAHPGPQRTETNLLVHARLRPARVDVHGVQAHHDNEQQHRERLHHNGRPVRLAEVMAMLDRRVVGLYKCCGL